MKLNKVFNENNNFSRVLFLFGIFLLYAMLFIAVFFFMFYIHELGHMLFGFLDGLLKGQINSFTIVNWVRHPLLQLFWIPQQTKIIAGQGSANFALGGPFLIMLIAGYLSGVGCSRSKDKKWFLIALSIAMFEISGNIICGTDNLYSSPLSFCNHNLDMFIQFLAIAIFSGTFSFFITKKFEEAFFRRKL